MKKKQISTYLTEDEIVLFDEACNHYNMSRYKMLDKFVKLGLKSFEKVKNSNTARANHHNTNTNSNTETTSNHNTIFSKTESVSDSTIESKFRGEEAIQDALDQSDYSPSKMDRKASSMAEEKLKKLHALKSAERHNPELVASGPDKVEKTLKNLEDAFNF